MEKIYKVLIILFIVVSLLLIVGVASYVTERSGLSGIMGQAPETKAQKKLTKEEMIQKWTSIVAYIFLFLALLLSIISQQIFEKY
ncbi:MAG: preprotein translocase subunit SecG [Candidatus Calescibacterium sp.]|nr:preprotein translocase subunit SecG [Candidatus Calescibacterium sp.]MCX7972038.1 preprotein translocase subunit SecG [bacterium]MDW8194678.1 preprotein translocase subunit SecG [Candidatus Calescibacterium sp.]